MTSACYDIQCVYIIVVQWLSRVWLLATPWTEAHQVSLFFISLSLIKFMSVESMILSNYLILCCPLLFCLQSFPASGFFPMSWLFTSGGQSIGASASASVLPMNIQGWLPLRLTGLISLWQISPAPQFGNINFLVLTLLYGPTLTFIYDY